jgi:hypothetical protein
VSKSYRVEIVQEDGGWWVSHIVDSKGDTIFQYHARSEEDARTRGLDVVARSYHQALTPEITVRKLSATPAPPPAS